MNTTRSTFFFLCCVTVFVVLSDMTAHAQTVSLRGGFRASGNSDGYSPGPELGAECKVPLGNQFELLTDVFLFQGRKHYTEGKHPVATVVEFAIVPRFKLQHIRVGVGLSGIRVGYDNLGKAAFGPAVEVAGVWETNVTETELFFRTDFDLISENRERRFAPGVRVSKWVARNWGFSVASQVTLKIFKQPYFPESPVGRATDFRILVGAVFGKKKM